MHTDPGEETSETTESCRLASLLRKGSLRNRHNNIVQMKMADDDTYEDGDDDVVTSISSSSSPAPVAGALGSPSLAKPRGGPRSVREVLRGLRRSLRNTPLGRVHAWLERARGASPSPFAAPMVPPQPDEAVEQDSVPMLPLHLPPRPTGLDLRPGGGRRLSRRRARRHAIRRWAWEVTEWQVALFDLWETERADSSARAIAALGQWRVSPRQWVAFHALMAENLRFGRLAAKVRTDAAGRGHATLRDHLTHLESHLAETLRPKQSFLPQANMAGALPVQVDRIAVADPAGQVRPEDHLQGELREQFLHPEWRDLPPDPEREVPRCCFMVGARDEKVLRRKLIRSGMAELVPEAEIMRDAKGDLVLAGMFAVSHKAHVDRLIIDRRPANSLESRLGWARLPLGSQLIRLVLRRGQGIRGSGDDLRTYFYCLRGPPTYSRRTCFGRAISGQEARALGGDPRVTYRLGLRVEAMGDLNAVDVAHETHRSILIQAGCLDPRTELIYGSPFPKGQTLEGLYIDDHFVLQIMSLADLSKPEGPDKQLIEASHRAYEAAGVPRAPEKGFGFSAPQVKRTRSLAEIRPSSASVPRCARTRAWSEFRHANERSL